MASSAVSASVGLRGLPVVLIACMTFIYIASGRQVLRWSEEFRFGCNSDVTCINNGIDLTKFGFELGDGTSYGPSLIGWGNWQRQCHTNSSENARVEAFPNSTDGMLVIQAGYSPLSPCYNPNAPASVTSYTSARLVTRNKAAFKWRGAPGNSTPVRIDVRLQVPLVNGTWPAAWMLPETTKPWCMGCGPYGDGWCLGGEIDIMEHINTKNYTISNVQYGGLANASWLQCQQKVRSYQAASRISGWNVISLIWDSTYIAFRANDREYHRVSLGTWHTGGAPNNTFAPFDVPFYLIFDMAVGGLYPGFNIDNGKVAAGEAKFKVDYVRVWDLLP